MEQEPIALIVGVTGMVGVALAEALKNPTALGGPWQVYGVSRHPLPSWFPSSFLDKHIILDTLDKENTQKTLAPLSSHITHVFWLAISVNKSEELNISCNSTMLSNVLDTLTSGSPNSKLCHVTLQTGTQQYMGPIHDVALSAQLIPHEAPFREDYPRLNFPNFYHALEDVVASYPKHFTYSIHRASIIIGASSRSFYNSLLSLSIYALICKQENYLFSHRFSIKGRVYPVILPVENKKITGRVLLGITAPELDILDKFEDYEYEKKLVNVSLLVLQAYTYVWVNSEDPDLYGEWDFEVWKESKMKDFLNMTMGFVEEQEQPESKPRVATYESYYNQNDGHNLSS